MVSLRAADRALIAAALPPPQIARLGNGLRVAWIDRPASPVVSTALCYRAGRRHDHARHGGSAHFLEHMMFRGSARFGAGELDRLTRRAGGHNNAFTTHDATLYEFAFAREHWPLALVLEADRMHALRIDPDDVERERRVIEEEIAMYRDDPWDALEQAVLARLFGRHPYGRAVLGRVADLRRTDASVLAAFHQRHYRPENAVLAIAGGAGEDVVARAEEAFAQPARTVPMPAAGPGHKPDPAPARAPEAKPRARATVRIRRHAGEVPRLLIALRAPPGDAEDHACLELLLAVLTTGRSSRLHRQLVDRQPRCAFVSAQVQESPDPGALTLAAELLPGVEPARVEACVLEALGALVRTPPAPAELRRARRMMVADWVFAHQRVEQQAVTSALTLGLFDAGHPRDRLGRLLTASRDRLHAAAQRWLDPEAGAVIGWSFDATGHGDG